MKVHLLINNNSLLDTWTGVEFQTEGVDKCPFRHSDVGLIIGLSLLGAPLTGIITLRVIYCRSRTGDTT